MGRGSHAYSKRYPGSKGKQQISAKPAVSPNSKERATLKDLRELGSCKPDGWSELQAESFLWQQMKVVSATVAGSCLCAGVPNYRREHCEHASKRRAGVLGRGIAKRGTCQLLCWVCTSTITTTRLREGEALAVGGSRGDHSHPRLLCPVQKSLWLTWEGTVMDPYDLPSPLQFHSVPLQTIIKHRGLGRESPPEAGEQLLAFHRAAGAPEPR